jgi:hypothetical protein
MHHKKDNKGLNVKHTQHSDIPHMKHETVITPSISQPQFGSYFIIDFKEKGCLIHNIGLEFIVSSITGLTGTLSNYPHYVPALFFYHHIEIVINNNIIDTIYPLNAFVQQQYTTY